MEKDKAEVKQRYAHALPPSQVKKMDKLARQLGVSRAELYRVAAEDLLIKHGVK